MANDEEKPIEGKGFTVQDRRRFSPETGEARDLLRRYTALKIALTWPEISCSGLLSETNCADVCDWFDAPRPPNESREIVHPVIDRPRTKITATIAIANGPRRTFTGQGRTLFI